MLEKTFPSKLSEKIFQASFQNFDDQKNTEEISENIRKKSETNPKKRIIALKWWFSQRLMSARVPMGISPLWLLSARRHPPASTDEHPGPMSSRVVTGVADEVPKTPGAHRP